MDQKKKWYLSTGVWGCIIIILNGLVALLADPSLGILNVTVSMKLIAFINLVAGAIGARGRIKAKSVIG